MNLHHLCFDTGFDFIWDRPHKKHSRLLALIKCSRVIILGIPGMSVSDISQGEESFLDAKMLSYNDMFNCVKKISIFYSTLELMMCPG